MIPLFTRYPDVQNGLPYRALGTFPTPCMRLSGLEKELQREGLFIKRDDMSGQLYGGNKVRKLEFLLGKALTSGASRIITSGAAGSNHALATALYAQHLGLKSVLMLFSQPASSMVCKNLLADFYADAEMHYDTTYESHLRSLKAMLRHYEKHDGRAPYVIPAGGSSVEGTVGYVNAAFELADQIAAGDLPLPSRIVVATGTMGTAAGLLLGLKAAQVSSKLTAVRVVPSFVASVDALLSLSNDVNRLLHDADRRFPIINLRETDLDFEHSCFGTGYGEVSPQANYSVDLLLKTDGVELDGVYTGKACAAFLARAKDNSEKGSCLLFWNTKNSRPLPDTALNADYHRLPSGFHSYFTDTASAV